MAIDLLCRNYLLQELKITRAWLLLQHFNSGALQFLRSSCLRSLDIEGLKYTRHAITQSIIGHCPDTLQELRLVFSDSTRLYDEDAEHSPEDVTIVPRVHPSLRALTLKFPRIDRQLEIVLCDLIQSSPNLQEFTFYSLTQPLSKIITCLAKNCPVLNSVDFTATPIPEADMHCFIALCPPLYSLGMTFQSDHHRGVIPSLISRFGHTLQELRIHGSDLPPNSDHGFIVSVLAHCPCLKTLSIDSDHLATNKGVALQDLLAVEWATTSLEDLCLAISIPKDDAEIYRLLQEWKHHQGIYLYPGEYDPEGPIGRCRTYVNQFLQFFKNLQAQPRLTSLKLKWGQGGCLIPCEFAEVFTGGELTVEKLSRIMLNLSSLKAVSKVFRSRERKAEEYKREQEIYDKLSSCNIVVENVETPREMGGDNGRAAEKSSWQPDSNSYDDHEYSLYKSRKARKMHYKEK
ncbi:hypothetical protein EC991_007443 [Linnemannia zychae]|nr:hypothetical protein EC991_007443 [Linnemannia zychae]